MKFVGPPLSQGPMPALIYLALSDQESLYQDPFNQPVVALNGKLIRVFSFTIPGHGPDLDPTKAIAFWESEYQAGRDILSPFFDQTVKAIEELIDQNIATKVAVAGLSRGVYCACHIAARTQAIKHILGFAPMIKFRAAPQLALDQYIDQLSTRTIRFYMGNRDIRTGTDICYSFMRQLVESAFEKRIRSAPIEMIISPSIGHQGHGTPPHTFQAGSHWIWESLQ